MFKKEWLLDPEFIDWVSGFPDEEDAYCKLCDKYFSVRNGRSALRSHAKGIKHTQLMNQNRRSRHRASTSCSSSSRRLPVSRNFHSPSQQFERQEISYSSVRITSNDSRRERSPIFGMPSSSRSWVEERRPDRYRFQKKSLVHRKRKQKKSGGLKTSYSYEKSQYEVKDQQSSEDEDSGEDEDEDEDECEEVYYTDY